MSDKKNTTVVNGFAFANEAEAVQAAKEAEGVKYIKAKTDMDNPEMVLHIYYSMIRQDLFETAVGISYLKDLQEYLQTTPIVKAEDIIPIPVQHPLLEESYRGRRRPAPKPKTAPRKMQKVVNADYKKRYLVFRAISVILAVCVVSMFVITATTNNTTILNYEAQLINKYEAWEQELNEREQAVGAQEQALSGME